MNERIEKLLNLTLEGKMYVDAIETKFDREDLFLTKQKMESKRICEYLLNQEPKISEYSKMTGFFRFDNSVVGTAFQRSGHAATDALMKEFFRKPVGNLSAFEWQHATPDYRKVLSVGIKGIIEEIDKSLEIHNSGEEAEFLSSLKDVALALVGWAHKCSKRAKEFAQNVKDKQNKSNLIIMAEVLERIPYAPPKNLYEAILCVYICYGATMDSPGALDRFFRSFYKNDIEKGVITNDEAKEYLQEFFLMLQATKHPDIPGQMFTVGSESHFCVGGYLSDGSDGFDEFSHLVVESLMELPIYNPQMTFRWTKKTPREVFRYMMDCERKDNNKRLAFTNDDKRIKCYTEICGIEYEKAVEYTTTGCNEPAFLGSITGSNSKINLLRCVETLFHSKSDEIVNTKSFDEFYNVFEKELFSDLSIALDYDDKYNLQRAKDINYISTLFFNDCIEKATSLTRGGGESVVASPMLMGITNVIDSLSIVNQFVFEEKIMTMKEIINAVCNNWEGYGDEHAIIMKKGNFFGNNDKISNDAARRLYKSFYDFYKDRTNVFGYHWLVGDLTGQFNHGKQFGEATKATPDGRFNGDLIKFGLGQSEGKDRQGLSSLLYAIATIDPTGIGCGSTVTNILIDEQLVKNDDNFEKTVALFETYFKLGGVHFQLTYVSKEDLLNARTTPENYKNLRVRVSGFSDYFINLQDGLQLDIIERTNKK